jgi:CMP-N-acetylneuraminic acid synthetase
MRTLAIIPARGGSKRIPGKNLQRVPADSGLTLLALAIRAAATDVVVVSSDDDEILGMARAGCAAFGPTLVHRRKPEHATDDAQLEPVIADVLAQVERIPEAPFDAIVLLQPTSPFRTAAHVAQALRILRETGCDSVVSVTPNHRLHSSRRGHAWTADSGGLLYRPAGDPDVRPPSASCSSLVEENGAVYAFTRAHWERTGSRMGGDMRALVMHWAEAVDIDTPEDLEAARRLARD